MNAQFPDNTTVNEPKMVPAMILGWLFPGGGHFYLGEFWKAMFCTLGIGILFGSGLYLCGGTYVAVEHFPFYLMGKMGSGFVLIVHSFFTSHEPIHPDQVFHYYEIGVLFIASSGLLNFVSVLNIVDVVFGRTGEREEPNQEEPDSQENEASVEASDASSNGSDNEKQEEIPASFIIKDNLDMIAVAFLMALVIRCFFVEVFKIPSKSMEPTLKGDLRKEQRSGDRIMVNKFYYQFHSVDRYDVIVFRYPLNVMRNFIKRAVGVGGETGEYLRFWKGNVFSSENRNGRYEMTQKPLSVQRVVWIPFPISYSEARGEEIFLNWKGEGTEPASGEKKIRIRAQNQKDGRLEFRKPVVDGPVNTVKKGNQRFHLMTDVNIKGEYGAFDEGTVVEWRLYDRGRRFVLRISPDAKPQLVYYSRGKERKRWSVKELNALGADANKDSLSFYLSDGRVGVDLNGRNALLYEYKNVYREIVNHDKQQPIRNKPEIRVDKGTISLYSLQLYRDIYYHLGDRDTRFTPDEPVFVPPGEFFVIGDNVNRSRDSRKWKQVVVKVKDGGVRKPPTVASSSDSKGEGTATKTYKIDLGMEMGKGGTWKNPLGDTDENRGYVYDIYGRLIKKPKKKDIVSKKVTPVRFVPENYLVGKALWVWWPSQTWSRFKLIR